MRARTVTACLAAACLGANCATAGIAPPLHAFSPASVPAGQAEVRVGVEYSLREWSMFESSNTRRELYRLPDLTLTLGMSDRVELVLNFPWLWLQQGNGSLENGAGDLKITGIYNLLDETESRPAGALVVSTKLPDANYRKGFGTDQTDFWAGGAFSKKLGYLRILANVSLGILEAPTGDEPNQDDVLVFDVGAVYPTTGDLSMSVGFDGIANSRFGNDRLFIRGGVALKTEFGTFDFGAGTGLNEASGDLHVVAGFSTALGFWDR